MEEISLNIKLIKNTIINLNCPFNISDLFLKLDGIISKKFICKIIDELCDSEFIKYIEINNNCYGFILNK